MAERKIPLWSLLAGVVMVALVLTVWIPRRLRARYAASERNGITALREYAQAQEIYRKSHAGAGSAGAYAASFRDLGGSEAGEGPGLLPESFAQATKENGYCGYFFTDAVEDLAGNPLQRTEDYGLFAHPCRYGRTGVASYCVFADGTVYAADAGEDLPAGTANPPACRGRWEPLER